MLDCSLIALPTVPPTQADRLSNLASQLARLSYSLCLRRVTSGVGCVSRDINTELGFGLAMETLASVKTLKGSAHPPLHFLPAPARLRLSSPHIIPTPLTRDTHCLINLFLTTLKSPILPSEPQTAVAVDPTPRISDQEPWPPTSPRSRILESLARFSPLNPRQSFQSCFYPHAFNLTALKGRKF